MSAIAERVQLCSRTLCDRRTLSLVFVGIYGDLLELLALPSFDSGGVVKNRTGISRGKFEEDAHFGNSPPMSHVSSTHHRA
jgi:hypothetical protein